MSELVLGRRMVRIDDGQRGVVAMNGPELRIVYTDRGEERLALKSERWRIDEPAPLPLRTEEIWLIARYADMALRAYERHEPLKYWETPERGTEPYDGDFVGMVCKYLHERLRG